MTAEIHPYQIAPRTFDVGEACILTSRADDLEYRNERGEPVTDEELSQTCNELEVYVRATLGDMVHRRIDHFNGGAGWSRADVRGCLERLDALRTGEREDLWRRLRLLAAALEAAALRAVQPKRRWVTIILDEETVREAGEEAWTALLEDMPPAFSADDLRRACVDALELAIEAKDEDSHTGPVARGIFLRIAREVAPLLCALVEAHENMENERKAIAYALAKRGRAK